ncbi:FkbM family methyltransferase [Natronorubrum halophilum]|uniref:FkbM family methyltransferase n=1 Tax=Natronorubrum halophilum TaxID=1702106 RepID=UPI001EE81124|nr:FkbM family methyltransferase [Natronorubrum halophilum]
MTVSQKLSKLLQNLRSNLYTGAIQESIHKTGLNKHLSEPYWALIYALTDDFQTHTIANQTINFRTETYTEFIRFRDLGHEQRVIKGLLESLESNDVFYDIGANVGTYTCFGASKLNSNRTISFEPEPQNAARLRDNLAVNDLEAQIIEVALSDVNGTVDFGLTGEETGEGEHSIATEEDTTTIEVETARGDSIIKQRGLPKPTVVKIDVEGAEMSVLRGLRKTISKHVRLIYVEVHSEKLSYYGDTSSEVRMFLEEAGFSIAEIPQRRSEVFLRASK